jgi:hypothetical protein
MGDPNKPAEPPLSDERRPDASTEGCIGVDERDQAPSGMIHNGL